jgi:serine/threonine protein kinase
MPSSPKDTNPDSGQAPPHRRPSTPPPDEPAFRARLQRAIAPEYELVEAIGQGGFGRVYTAKDVRLGRQVAIKTVRPELVGNTTYVEQFRREGSALARLRHPAVIPIYDIRESDGMIWLVMPFIEGESLRHKLDTRGRIPPKVVLRMLIELCDAVAASHRAGVVHRDIKPANVILEGRHEKVLLMDFGIAKLLESGAGTEEGMWFGTPTYMAPEQIESEGWADERSDIYSLGAIAYHALTGRPPYEGPPMEVFRQRLTANPPPIRSINPSVPLHFAAVVERCLEREPLDRFENVAELFDQLQHVTFVRETEAGENPHEPLTSRLTWFLTGLAVATALGAWVAPLVSDWISPSDSFIAAGGIALAAALTSPRLREFYLDWKQARR